MKACIDCARWAAAPGWWRQFNPGCPECGGRYLWAIQRQKFAADVDKSALLRKVLADWMAAGHDEQQLRALAKRQWLKPKG